MDEITEQAQNTEEQPKTITMANGAKRDAKTGRIVAGAVLSRADAQRMVRARVEKKRAVIAAAAQAAVQNGELVKAYGNEAWLAEIAQTQQEIATTPDAGKASIMAAEWLVRHSGLGEPSRLEREQVQTTHVHTIDPALASAISRLLSMRGQDVVDVEAEDVGNV